MVQWADRGDGFEVSVAVKEFGVILKSELSDAAIDAASDRFTYTPEFEIDAGCCNPCLRCHLREFLIRKVIANQTPLRFISAALKNFHGNGSDKRRGRRASYILNLRTQLP